MHHYCIEWLRNVWIINEPQEHNILSIDQSTALDNLNCDIIGTTGIYQATLKGLIYGKLVFHNTLNISVSLQQRDIWEKLLLLLNTKREEILFCKNCW